MIGEFIFFGVLFLKKRSKTHLINKRELLLGSGVSAILLAIAQAFITTGAIYPSIFILLNGLAFIIAAFGLLLYMYFWEQNLINLKKIPSFFALITVIFSIIDLVLLDEGIIGLIVLLIFFISLLVSFVFLVVLVIIYLQKVSGSLKILAIVNLFYIAFLLTAILLDHIPIISLAPDIFIVLSPVFFNISIILGYFSTLGINEQISSYYNQAHICTVHRGPIRSGSKVYICPDCSTIYCNNCFEQVIKNDGCWNCQEQVKLPNEKEKDSILIENIENSSSKPHKAPKHK